jgi:glutamate 5-kinase
VILLRFALLIVSSTALASCSFPLLASNPQQEQEKQACAEIGQKPGTDGFTSCFVALDSSITNDLNPAAR